MKDLRWFLDRIRKERPTDIIEIEHPVEPRFELTAIISKFEERQRSPVLFAKSVKGTAFPVVANICGSIGRIAFALDCPLRDVAKRYAAAIETPIKPVLIAAGPVHEIIFRKEDVDLYTLPALVHHEDDASSPYITAAIAVAKDPETGKINLSFHRLMVAGKNYTGILIEPGKHLDVIYQKHRKLGIPMPLACFIGSPPAWLLGALYSGVLEEYDVIGGLLNDSLPIVECCSLPGLFVPAFAEISLEGFVDTEQRIKEGPFGEWPGFSTGITTTPVFSVNTITMRRDAIFQDIVSGHMEHLILEMPAIEYRMLNEARTITAGVESVSLLAPFFSVVKLNKNSDDEPKRILDVLLKNDIQAKNIIVVDSDVNINDPKEIFRVLGLNTQADRDFHIYPNEQGTSLDPSCTSIDSRTAKMGIDATRKSNSNRQITLNKVPQHVLDSVDISTLLRK